ncbi:hypothetical protein [Bifidobacterium xylocopae]|uniref:Uncharacterized protein n=1 Tax=Bifidobacterium xylocopae TaxID=2493119 RepID=A0A366KHA9_9BIFI|nr:hypothetical protein [Bifidobacterium xylocopae]RBQ00072.1 hypothetical protein CRD59_01005 [Bifidobacterium xylocopae]
MVTALGVARDEHGVGMDALTHRRILGAYWENLGVVSGLEVSGAAGLRYQASAGVAVCSTGGSDGSVEAYWPGGVTVEAVRAGDGAYPRIDLVYLLADTSAGGQVSLHVAQGVPAASPSPPALPAGGLRLRDLSVPAGASSTQSATPVGSVDYAIPYGASLGRLGIYEDKRSLDAVGTEVRRWYPEYDTAFYVPTDRLIELVYDTDVICRGGSWLSWASTFQLDGQDVPNSSMETEASSRVSAHQHNSRILEVSQGNHVARVKHGMAAGEGHPYFHYGMQPENGLTYPGRTLQVWDRGPAK